MNLIRAAMIGGALFALAACAPQARDEAAPAQPAPAATATAPAPPAPAAERVASEPAAAPAETPAMTKGSDAAGSLSGAWTLSDGGRDALKTGAAAEITLEIADGQASGFGGCNRYNTSVAVDGTTVTFGPIAATKRGCPGDAGATEVAYFEALSTAQSATFDGDALVLQLADGSTLRYARAASTP